MSIEGLWTVEIFGLNGWENAGVVVLRDAHVLGGGRHHFSTGTYNCSGEDFSMSLSITYHGQPRTLFGSSDRNLSLSVEGQIDREEIEGSAFRAGNPKQSLSFCLTKRAELP